MRLILLTSTTDTQTTSASAAAIGEKGGARLQAGCSYQYTCTLDTWIRQGTATLVTCVAKASLVDGETVTIAFLAPDGTTKFASSTYEFDVNGTGVAAGNVQVNVSSDTTAANVAARLRTAILATQAALTVVDNADGTLSIAAPDINATYSKTVANVGFTFADAIMPVAKADGNLEVFAKSTNVLLDGANGPHVGVIQDAGAGLAFCTRVQVK